MLSKLGVVTNIWAKRLEAGDRFEDLVKQFRDAGFMHFEIRDGDYLRQSAFGDLLRDIETAMDRYSDFRWKTFCDGIREGKPSPGPAEDAFFRRMAEFTVKTAGVVFSYAVAHPWMVPPASEDTDSRTIARAKKLAYLLCPSAARLRLVDPDFSGPVDTEATVANLERYRSLTPEFPVTLCVENAQLPATRTLEIAIQGGWGLAYDEANTYRIDGSPLNPPDAFWGMVTAEQLTSVHIKQKTAEGITPQIGAGYVDFGNVLRHLITNGYTGDLLLENAPSNQPLEDARRSREYLVKIGKGIEPNESR